MALPSLLIKLLLRSFRSEYARVQKHVRNEVRLFKASAHAVAYHLPLTPVSFLILESRALLLLL